MPLGNEQQNEEKKVLTIDEIEFLNKDLQDKYDELMQSSSLLQSEKAKWKATFDEFDDFYNNAPCGYHTVDENGLILKMNQTELNWLGYTREEVVNKMNILDLLSDKSTMMFYKYMPIMREKGQVDQLEVEYVGKDGRTVSALVSARAIFDEEKRLKCVNSTLWDISDRKKMEEEMLKVNRHLRAIKERFEEKNTLAQKLNEELMALKQEHSDVYGKTGSHVAQPLAKLLPLCKTLLNSVEAGSDQAQSLKKILETISDVTGYVSNMRLQQRISSDTANLELCTFNLSALLVTIVNRLEESAMRKRLSINCEIFEDVVIKSDKEVLGQVVDTLLTTVIKVSQPGKEIPLRLIHKVNNYLVELEINGLTMSRDELAALFDKEKQDKQQQLIEAGTSSQLVLNSRLLNSLVESLGLELSVSPLNHKGTLIRLSLPGSLAV
ncbi:MAG: sensor signal transduction histidine kinase [Flavipsychrobacter sp.]|jgi:PAS domain S-box-containing protein|nr:sensor signal transduction histidine kinase [Flavipsychrobacter sp.]